MKARPIVWVLLPLALFAFVPDRASGRNADTTAAELDSTYLVDEIVVTATRTHKKIIDVPYAIDRVRMDDVKFQRMVTVDDVLGDIPGLFLQSRYGNHDVRISMRGFGSRSNTGIRGVRILLDGIPESEPDGQTRIEAIDFQSLGSIEVVRGNASSLYTNAPGGVINFISDIRFPSSFFTNFNQFGSFYLRQNGFKSGVRTDRYGLLTTYSYHNARGYRAHGEDYWHIVNTALEVNAAENATLRIYGYAADGLMRLPGSLTKEQLDADPFQANMRDVSRDTKRITRKGRLGIRYESTFGEDEIELTTYGTIKSFERTAGTYRVFNRDGLGASARFVTHRKLAGRRNEFSVGGDWFYQYGPIQEYENINGKKGDILLNLTDERIGNAGAYAQNSFTLIPERLDFLLTGRYDNVRFNFKNQILEVRSAGRRFEDFTPKAAFNFKLTPTIAAYTSYGLGFDTPAGNELDNFPTSSNTTPLINPDLKPQHSKNYEIGIKGDLIATSSRVFSRVHFGATYFTSIVKDEIVPFDVFGDVFFRNSARTHRSGIEIGLDADVVAGLRCRGAYTFSDFTYDEYAAGTVEIDDEGNIVTAGDDFSGNTVPTVPKNNFSVSLSYERSLAARVTGFVKANYAAVSGLYVDDANSAQTEGYHLVDPLVGIDVAFGKLDLLLSGGANNIFDETYVGFVNINSTAKEFYEAGEPRNYFGGLNAGYRF